MYGERERPGSVTIFSHHNWTFRMGSPFCRIHLNHYIWRFRALRQLRGSMAHNMWLNYPLSSAPCQCKFFFYPPFSLIQFSAHGNYVKTDGIVGKNYEYNVWIMYAIRFGTWEECRMNHLPLQCRIMRQTLMSLAFLPYQIDSDAALLPYVYHLGSAHEWSGVWTRPEMKFRPYTEKVHFFYYNVCLT